MMWKPVVGRNVYAQGGYVQDLIKQNPGMEKDSTVKMALFDEQEREKFFAPDPTMYRNDAKNMKNVQEYLQDQGVKLVGKRQKPTAADVLANFQAGQGVLATDTGTVEQGPVPVPQPPESPGPAQIPGLPQLTTLPQSSGVADLIAGGTKTGSNLPSLTLGRLGQNPMPQMVRGGAVRDYRQGGPVSGGPPGVDTVPAMLTNKEYVLPVPTTQALGGKPVLDQVVLATTGKPPVGYADGGSASGWSVNRAKQIEDAVNGVLGQPPIAAPVPQGPQVAPLLTPDEQAWMEMQRAKEAEQMVEQKPAWRKMLGLARGGEVQGYQYGGMPNKRRTIPWYAMPGQDLVYENGVAVPAALQDEARPLTGSVQDSIIPDLQRNATELAGRAGAAALRAFPDLANSAGQLSMVRTAKQIPDEVRSAYQREGMPGAIGEAIRGGLAVIPAAGMDVLQGIRMLIDPPAQVLEKAVTGKIEQPAVPVTPTSQTLTPSEQEILALKPGMRDIPVPRPIMNEGPGAPVSETVGPLNAAQANATFRQNVAAIPKGGTERKYGDTTIYMSRDPKTGVPIFSNISARAATPEGFEEIRPTGPLGGNPLGSAESAQQTWQLVRDMRNMRREAEGSPRVGEVRGQVAAEGLKPSDQIALANLQRGLSNDQRDAVQNEFTNRVRLDERQVARQEATAKAQDRYLAQAEPFMQKLSADFPWMGEEAPTFFQQAATVRPTNPAAAVSTLAGVQQALAANNEVLFELGGQKVTGAQAVALLNGEEPFNTWMPFGSPNADTYKALRKRAAEKVQQMALRELAQ